MKQPNKTKGTVGVVSEATPTIPTSTISTPGAIREINTKGLSRAEIVAINRSIGDPLAAADLLALCLPCATPQITTIVADGQLTTLPILESA